MTDPSTLVPRALLRHVHLISTFQYPKMPQFDLNVLVEHLIQAPKVVKDHSPMNWMFLQSPQDGDVFLTYQPPQMGIQLASDGYVWADAEQPFSTEVRGYKIEMYQHRSGFRMPSEPMTAHARRRLHLVPSSNPDPSLPPPDSSLWIIYYGQADPQNHFPSQSVRISDHVRQHANERLSLQRHGQLVRKEFMLYDSASWPTINLPGNSNQAYPQQSMGYPNDVMAHMNRSQQQAYMQQQQANVSQRGIGPSPSKRPRHGTQGSMHGSATAIPAPMVPQDPSLEDEDGTVGGDYMDFMTPRDISLHRYIQHHEWLEEILESPYDTSQIVPGDLGLGCKGELESLTRDFFEAPVDPTPKDKFDPKEPSRPVDEVVVPKVGRLEPEKAEDFTRRASEKVAQINDEMDKLKRQHARRMSKLSQGHTVREATRNLRHETIKIIYGDLKSSGYRVHQSVDELTSEVTGKRAQPILDIECIQSGGLEEKNDNDHDYDMIDNFQFDGASDERPPAVPDLPKSIDLETVVDSAPTQDSHSQTEPTSSGETEAKVAETHIDEDASKTAPTEDWIMVNKNGSVRNDDQDLGIMDQFTNDAENEPETSTLEFIQD